MLKDKITLSQAIGYGIYAVVFYSIITLFYLFFIDWTSIPLSINCFVWCIMFPLMTAGATIGIYQARYTNTYM